jgi:ribonuclease P protein component
LRRRDEFVATLRAGRRRTGGRPKGLVVAHVAAPPVEVPGSPVRAGLVVSRAVGDAVVRNTVKRRLRHLLAARLGSLPAGSRVVVRALPPAAKATSAELGAALDDALPLTRGPRDSR